MVFETHHRDEQDYPNQTVEVETSNGQRISQETYLIRVYPEPFNGLDAYMDIPLSQEKPDFKTVHFSNLDITWEVVTEPSQSPINGWFRGDNTKKNPPAWVMGLRKISPLQVDNNMT
ncbi:valyl-tRNA synthetase [Nostoc sp. NIES-4103]|nr:valyl-tRNA synthetase [Nostoc sp. NIES-4103]